jgi:hypothetical protein
MPATRASSTLGWYAGCDQHGVARDRAIAAQLHTGNAHVAADAPYAVAEDHFDAERAHVRQAARWRAAASSWRIMRRVKCSITTTSVFEPLHRPRRFQPEQAAPSTIVRRVRTRRASS